MGKILNYFDFIFILCQVIEIDVERQRFLVSFKMFDCCLDQSIEVSFVFGVELLESYFLERWDIFQQLVLSLGKIYGEVQYCCILQFMYVFNKSDNLD